VNKGKKITINKIINKLNGNSINSLLESFKKLIKNKLIVIDRTKTNPFIKLFIKAPFSAFFLDK
jgi:hypothetical protein